MTGLLIALAVAAWSALCVTAGGLYVHHRYTGRIRHLTAEPATRRSEFNAARDLWAQQIERARTHTLAVTR